MALRSNIFIRRAEREDLDTIVEWMEDPDFQLFLYGDVTRSQRQIREQIVGLLGRAPGHTMPGAFQLILESETDGPVGLVLLQNVSWRNRSCSLDVYIGQKNLRKGIVIGLAFFRIMEYCFDELNLHRVSAYIYSFNSPSWRIMERSNAKRELTLKDHVVRDGELYDMYCYGLLRREFNELRESLEGRMTGKSLVDMIEALHGKDEETGG
ncbi:MAG TPA: GNAT family protein [Candidatus Hydrogenedentes bacterium]|nr:GNAT family protein [Candidatus Hydrogenedentota bacterium]HQE84662.1 GNAT family protein [Candidatus Hydrogenedentota bacterium]HQH53694.1 GNAT family protein [Candidatus Hydrogenedentota bacterium]HQM49770.1 GNAT family protein [Candidatus Hydrogenedentota bacterium]